MRFREIIGQERAKQQMRKAVREGLIPHAQLFVGPEGVGKLQLAIAYAQYLACPNRTEEDACGECPTCLQYQKLQHPDLHFAFPIVKTDAGDVCDDFIEPFRKLILEKGYFNLEDWYAALGVETKQGMIYEKESSEILRKL
ncbi:MAG: DNA polymerase III subunit delta, partial [Paludibacteraceae bacterium]|nr:DNA polymerase III subunit delta [Paludibacteraceae bacterium]